MRFLLSVFLILNLFFSLSCKTTTEEESTVSSSPSQSLEEPEEEDVGEKPQTIIVPTGSLGNISEVKKKMLEKTLESALDDHFAIVPKDLFEEAQEKAFEELDYEECTEEQCIMMIKEILQVENAFQLVLMEEDGDTQISLTWNDLDQKRVEEEYCEGCKTKLLRKSVVGLVEKLIGVNDEIVVKEEPTINVENNFIEKSKKINESLFIVVGEKGTILTSPHGIDWTKRKSGTEEDLFDVSVGNGIYVIVGSNGTILNSDDGGITWNNSITNLSNYDLYGATFGNSLFVAVGSKSISLNSDDGKIWHLNKQNKSEYTLYDVTFGNDNFVSVGEEQTIFSSQDGKKWKYRRTERKGDLSKIIFNNNKFYTVGDYTTILSSSNLDVWDIRFVGKSSDLYSIIYGLDFYLSFGQTDHYFKSKDGISWEINKFNILWSGTSKFDLYDSDYGNNLFIVVGKYGKICLSSDGKNWKKINSGTSKDLYGIIYN